MFLFALSRGDIPLDPPSKGDSVSSRPKSKTDRPGRKLAYWVVISLLVLAAFTSGLWLWRRTYTSPPRFNFVLISVNHESHKIFSGETFVLHPEDKVKILKISTSAFLNLGIRLVAPGFDVSALRYEESTLSNLLTDQEIFGCNSLRIRIKHRNQELGYLDWEMRPYAEDWLDKADRAVDTEQRLAILERALSFLPEDSRIWRRLLDEYRAHERWKQAALMLKKMARKNSKDREILVELLEIETSMGNKKGIISVLKRLIRLDPDDTEARTRLAKLLEEEGNRKAAIKEYEAILKRIDGKERYPVYKRVAYLCTKTGQFNKAISFYLKAENQGKKDATLYYNLSYLYEQIRQKEKADSYLAKALSLRPQDCENRLKLARNLMEKGELNKAKPYLFEVLEKEPASLDALLLTAQMMEKQGENRKLKRIYEKILSLDQKNETVIYNLGALEYEAGDLKASLDYFERYTKSHPNDAAVHQIIFDIHKRQKNAAEALKQAWILVKLKPKVIDHYHYFFDCLHRKGDYKKIISVMEEGSKVNPEQIDLREYLILAYLKTGMEEPAIKQMEAILKMRPKDIALLLRLARLQENQGNFTEALKAYKTIINISPDHEEAEEAYLRLSLMKLWQRP